MDKNEHYILDFDYSQVLYRLQCAGVLDALGNAKLNDVDSGNENKSNNIISVRRNKIKEHYMVGCDYLEELQDVWPIILEVVPTENGNYNTFNESNINSGRN